MCKKGPGMRFRASLTCVAILAGLLIAGAARGDTCSEAIAPVSGGSFDHYTGNDPRVREIDVEGLRVVVLVPPGYDEGTERYPVVYLHAGGLHTPDANFLNNTDLIEFTAHPQTEKAIVVMPDRWTEPGWMDWRNGEHNDQTFYTDVLIPTIDRTFRTIAGRQHRAIAGFSAGGLGSLHLGARRPDLFAAVGGLDALADLNDDVDRYYMAAGIFLSIARPACESGEIGAFGTFGDPVTDRVWWANANPTDLAANYASTSLDVHVANGQPCDTQDVTDYVSYWFTTQSLVVYPANERFHAALLRDGTPHSYNATCGVHSYRRTQSQIHDWWEQALAAFDDPPPPAFDYRAADPAFSVWQWTFEADARRAAEFLNITDASKNGITLAGSGFTTVTTAPYFRPFQRVALTGALEASVRADREGSITFHVDLGLPHTQQQYTVQADALELAGGYWRTRAVTFRPFPTL